ncbi:efflux RND transporter periplasmic adaptor subunit [Pengzhenrongella sicca]|uniref:Biotin/lipoyl-binding protein n=1 Tax=Pengzhenrongella sicca TaxID=2819238 RepID=A0A8A4ZFD8_9MICO|nr:biotin/lipoyl-binding protein [Pengzhenrongella sicca]QTE29719.1 biotin/lipoyl-binding protein [Pengzhenrongella sicca]
MRKLLRRIRPRTRVVAGILVVLVAGGGVYWFGVRDTTAAAASTGPTTQSVAASLTTMEQSVAASGTLTPTVQEDVSFAASGTVTAVAVAVGQTVTAGQTLATIDTLTLNADLLKAKATLASAQAKLSDSEDDADGTDESDSQIESNSAAVDVAQAAVDEAEAAMADATLVAPVAGLLTAVGVEVGDAVTGSSSSSSSSSDAADSSTGSMGASTGSTTTSTSTAQFTIVGTDSWEVDVTVDDSDVALIAVADQAEITLDGAEAPIFGTVSEIGLIATASSGVATYPVVVAVTGTPEGLFDGVAVDVVIVYERRTDVLTVPSAAVRTVDGESTVTQAGADGADVTTAVTVGATVDSMTEILTGLVEGDEVLVTVVQTSQQTTGEDRMGELPEGFTPGELPEGFDPADLPAGMGPGGQNNG